MEYLKPYTTENFQLVKDKCYTRELKDGRKCTKVTIVGPNDKKYTGRAFVPVEDLEYFNHLTGYMIAEKRAYISYMKKTSKELFELRNSLRDIVKYNSTFYSNKELKEINHKITELSKAINIAKERIKMAYKLIDKQIETSYNTMKRINALAALPDEGQNS